MIVIPDVHGRTFWKNAVKDNENEDIIFLGDYLDTYYWEGITNQEAIDNFIEIIKFKEEHMNNVTLLVGNHDWHYISRFSINAGRRITNAYPQIHELFMKHLRLFKIATAKIINDKMFTFSHSAILPKWLEEHFEDTSIEKIIEIMNDDLFKNMKNASTYLNDISPYRGGTHPSGSIIWSDVDELNIKGNVITDIYQIFGHSQQEFYPIIKDNYACLDVRKAFKINEKGEIKEI